ncbi:MAG: hypothetical protein R2807_00400 [Chitinophagales bacterium]
MRTRPNVTLAELNQELIGILRAARKLRPTQVDNFSINQLSVIAKGFDSVFGFYIWCVGLLVHFR